MKRTILVLAVAAGLAGVAMAQVSECGYTTYGNPALDAAARNGARVAIRSARSLLTQAKAAALAGDTSDAAQDRLMAKSDVQGVCSRKGSRLVWDDLVGRSAPVAPEGPSGYWAPPAPPAKTAGAHYRLVIGSAEHCALEGHRRRAQADLAAADKLLPFTTFDQRASAMRAACRSEFRGYACDHTISTLTEYPQGHLLPVGQPPWSPLARQLERLRVPYSCQ